MTRARADLGFGDPLEESDPLDGFDPKAWQTAPKARPPVEETKQAAEATGFRSREAQIPGAGQGAPETQAPKPRRRRTGRNAQFNLKAKPETIAAFCAVADHNGWGLGETLEHAVALLEQAHGPR